jgi:hypothetical protein
MTKKNKTTNNSKPMAYDTLLGVVKIDEFTGKKYNAIKKVKCNCPCHEPNSNMMHCFPCCDNGYNEERLYVDNNA